MSLKRLNRSHGSAFFSALNLDLKRLNITDRVINQRATMIGGIQSCMRERKAIRRIHNTVQLFYLPTLLNPVNVRALTCRELSLKQKKVIVPYRENYALTQARILSKQNSNRYTFYAHARFFFSYFSFSTYFYYL